MNFQDVDNNYRAIMFFADNVPSYWYFEANDITSEIANFYGLSQELVVNIVAATSPNVRWDWLTKDGMRYPNLECAISIIHGCLNGHDKTYVLSHSFGYNRNKSKAWDMVENNDGSTLSGQKVCSFYDNIMNPDNDTVTIDFWMIRCGLWQFDMKINDTSAWLKYYNPIADIVKNIANDFNVKPWQIQAKIWEYARTNQKQLVASQL